MNSSPVRGFTALLLLASASLAPAQNPGTVDLPRFPALSPDGRQLTFSWRGDLWIVDAGGGHATRLTAHPGDDLQSAWSPDGNRIAFSSGRLGSTDLYLMNADGTGITRVTSIDRGITLEAFGVDDDGNEVLTCSSYLEGDIYRAPRPYMVSTSGGELRRVHDAFGHGAVVSPDGNRVAFVRGDSSWTRRHYRGPDAREVWLYDRADASFTQLTDWEGNDGMPLWLDNDTILFASDRELDCVNVYRMDVDQGENSVSRLTSFEINDVVSFTVAPQAEKGVVMVWDRLYTFPTGGGDPQAIVITASEDDEDNFEIKSISRDVTEAALSPDGQVMAYVAYGEVYVRNIDERSPTRRVTRGEAHEHGIAWSPDGMKLYFTSDRDGSDSIYAATVDRTRGDVKDAFEEATAPPKEEDDAVDESDEAGDAEAADDDSITGRWDGAITRADGRALPLSAWLVLNDDNTVSGRLESARGSGTLHGSFAEDTLTLTAVIDDGSEVSLSLTLTNGSAEGTATMGDDEGTIALARAADPAPKADSKKDDKAKADEEDEDDKPDPKRWHDAMTFLIEPVLADPGVHHRQPRPSPDGKYLAYREGRGDLMLLDLETGESRNVMRGWDFWMDWRFSPDGKWIAWNQYDINFNSDIWVVPTDGSAPAVNITRHPDNDHSPRWSADSKIMTFISERTNEEDDVWMVYLDKDLEALTPQELLTYYSDAAKAAKDRKPLEPKAPKSDDEDAEADEPADPDETDEAGDADDTDEADAAKDDEDALDLDDAWLRLRRITSLPGGEGDLELTPDGNWTIFSGNDGGSGLFARKWDGSETKRIADAVSVQHLTLTGDKIIFVSGSRAGVVPVSGGKTEYYDISDRMRIDLQAQSSQKFLEAARILGELFYHPTMKDLDWPALTRKYHALARQARTADEFGHVANRFIGELNASHLGIYPSGGFSSPNALPFGRLGVTTRRADNGFEVLAILPESPAAKGEMALHIGDVITAVELDPFGSADTLESRLEGRVGEETIITVQRGDLGEIDLLLTPISYNAQRDLIYEAWRLDNARKVEELSDGRLGYIHVEGMNQPSLDVFERDLYAAAEGKDGLIIDVRNNGGGWTTDRLLASITYPQHAYTVPRGADPNVTTGYPQDRLFIQRYTLPINVLCNEKSFSNAEIFSHAFKTNKRGTLVGQETYGGVISTGGTSLIDGTFVRLPFRGWYLPDGTDMENNGAVPDILIPQTPQAESADNDEQLRAAVDDLLSRLD